MEWGFPKGHVTVGFIGCKQQKQCLLIEVKREFNRSNGIVYRVEGKSVEPDFRKSGKQTWLLLAGGSEENLTDKLTNNVQDGRWGCPRENNILLRDKWRMGPK